MDIAFTWDGGALDGCLGDATAGAALAAVVDALCDLVTELGAAEDCIDDIAEDAACCCVEKRVKHLLPLHKEIWRTSKGRGKPRGKPRPRLTW